MNAPPGQPIYSPERISTFNNGLCYFDYTRFIWYDGCVN